MDPKQALIVVDVQNDFVTGSLAVPGAKDAIPKINVLINSAITDGNLIFYTRDWHVPDHPSFHIHGGQWPQHCVMYTQGAEAPPELFMDRTKRVICKGMEKEAYSGFEGTPLARLLRYFNVKQVGIVGLATDYCVKHTALDARKLGLGVWVDLNACRGVDPVTTDMAIAEMAEAGIHVIPREDRL